VRENGQPASPGQMGQRLREVRTSMGMSLRELARRIEVSPSFLSQLERGRTNPSVGTLYAIVTQLGLSLDELMSESPDGVEEPAPEVDAVAVAPGVLPAWDPGTAVWPRIGVPVQRAAGRRTIGLSGVTWERLTHDDDPFVDFLYVTYQPGSASCSDEDMMRHGGREYGHLVSGRLDVQIAFEMYHLAAGDSIHFDSTVPHRLSNPYDEPCVAIWVVVARRGDTRVFEPPGAGASHLPGLM
jgi:transcriptional regulator with XRE-family HTH domain/mannose-6-phosphate isomerase-like protein (cupin superfamily)